MIMQRYARALRALGFAVFAAACGGGSDETTVPVVVPPDVSPVRLEAVSDTITTGRVATVAPASPSVLVRNKSGAPIANVTVTFTVTAGGGSVSTSAVATANDGTARTSWTFGNAAGVQSVSVSVAGLPPIIFRATTTAASAAKVAKVDGDAQNGVVGAVVARALTVKATDAFDNPVAGAVVNATIKSGQGTLTTSTATTNAEGLASIAGWTLGTKPGANEVEMVLGDLAPLRFTATAVAGPAERVAFTSTDTLVLARGRDSVFAFRGFDRFGNEVAPAGLTLRVDDASIATVASGTVTARAIGATFLTASIGAFSATRPLVVVGHPTGSSPVARVAGRSGVAANGIVIVSNSAGFTRFAPTGQALGSLVAVAGDPWLFRATPDASHALFFLADTQGDILAIANVTTGQTRLEKLPSTGFHIRIPQSGGRAWITTDRHLHDVSLTPSVPSRTFTFNAWISSLAHSWADSLVFVTTSEGDIYEMSARTLTLRRRWRGYVSTATAASPDGRYLYSGSAGRDIYTFRLADTSYVGSVLMSAPPVTSHSMVVSPDGQELYVATWSGSAGNAVEVYSLANPEKPALARKIPLSGLPLDITMDARGAFMVVSLLTTPALIEIIR